MEGLQLTVSGTFEQSVDLRVAEVANDRNNNSEGMLS